MPDNSYTLYPSILSRDSDPQTTEDLENQSLESKSYNELRELAKDYPDINGNSTKETLITELRKKRRNESNH